ncbi:Mitochondrial distribution and morphology protein 30 [Wickerhamomyces ciferrii]|uniref:Mitochondrial distribution and morphology protein 30 n=1 Tax=Wickerhamomyces ciferrii (strain ATCC 14091 / BCRC 22168 / CBS 111 / JCM 3599 / NBRC 0793 / NRRL Y-1031 F-60-10) TaxID=1206466 RepID=K0KKJ1_WICCF|nr:Mitochondrial distribution and morphology protein 30 [Wickerhamomyces ciferrii]CCH43496.1 Mitochondrial distribution and morphology protein 30 [Wickerhamomyces ciferrii]
MGVNYLELPYDALVKITDDLSQKDLLKLRILNHKSKKIIEALPVWQDFIEQKWLKYDDQDIGMDVTRNFKYFINRSMKDNYTTKKLKQIQSGNLTYKEIFETVWSLSDNFGVELTPILNKLIKTLDRAKNVCAVSYARTILQTTRHKMAYRLLDITAMQKPMAPISKVLGPVENFYFIISHLDPSFDNLLPYRSKVINQIIDELKYDKNFIKESPTIQIIWINKVFLKIIEQNGGKPKFSPITSEDGSIMRVYCGETLGLPLMRLAIIQKIAFELNIHCEILQCPMDFDPKNISTGVLRVFDTNYPLNVSYISLHPDFRGKKNLELIVQTSYKLSEELFKRKLVGRQTSAARFLKEFANKMLVAAFLSDMVEVKSRWDRNDLSQEPSKIFPVSKECLPHNNIILASGYFVLIQSHSKMSMKKPGQNVLKYLKNCDNHSNFVPIILKMYPWDLGVLNPKYISRAIPIEDLKNHTIKEFFDLKTSLELVPDDINKRIERIQKGAKRSVFLPNFFPGQIIEMEGLYYIVNGYIKGTADSPDQYSMIDVRRGMVGIGYETPDFKSVDPRHIDIEFIVKQNLIGAYFEKYDEKIQRFIPGKAIRQVYPGLEKLKGIESYSENTARGKSMIEHPELEPLIFDQIPVLALHEPQLVDQLKKASGNTTNGNGGSDSTINSVKTSIGKFDAKKFIMGTPEDFRKHVEKIVEEKFEEAIANDCDIETILSRDINEMLNSNGISDLMNAVGLDEGDIGKLMNIPTEKFSEIAAQQSMMAKTIMDQNEQKVNNKSKTTNGNTQQPKQQNNSNSKPKVNSNGNKVDEDGHTIPKDLGKMKSAQKFGLPGFMFGPFRPDGSLVTSDDEEGLNNEDPHAHCNHHFVEQDFESEDEEEDSDDELIDPNDPRFQMVAAAFKELQNASARGPAEFTSTLNALFGDGPNNRSNNRSSNNSRPSSTSTGVSNSSRSSIQSSNVSSNTSRSSNQSQRNGTTRQQQQQQQQQPNTTKNNDPVLTKEMNESLFDVE